MYDYRVRLRHGKTRRPDIFERSRSMGWKLELQPGITAYREARFNRFRLTSPEGKVRENIRIPTAHRILDKAFKAEREKQELIVEQLKTIPIYRRLIKRLKTSRDFRKAYWRETYDLADGVKKTERMALLGHVRFSEQK